MKSKLLCKKNYCHKRVATKRGCVKDSYRTISLGKGRKAIVCRLRKMGPRGGKTKMLSMMYPKHGPGAYKPSRRSR